MNLMTNIAAIKRNPVNAVESMNAELDGYAVKLTARSAGGWWMSGHPRYYAAMFDARGSLSLLHDTSEAWVRYAAR